MRRKSMVVETLIVLILVLAFIVLGINIVSVLRSTGEEALNKMWFDVGGFKPFDINQPVTGEDEVVYDSLKAYKCGVDLVADYDNMRYCYNLQKMYQDNPELRYTTGTSGTLPAFCDGLGNYIDSDGSFIDGKIYVKPGFCDGADIVTDQNDIREECGDDTQADDARFIFGTKCLLCGHFKYSDINDDNTYLGCTVNEFELPQQGTQDSTLEQWIAGMGDPQYIVYYEKFPEGEDVYWQADAWSFSPLLMLGSSVAVAVLPLSSSVQDAIKTANVGDNIVRAALRGAGENSFVGKQIVNLVKGVSSLWKWVAKDSVTGLLKKVRLKNILLQTDDLFIDPSTVDDKMEIVSRHVSDGRWVSGSDSTDLYNDLIPAFKADVEKYYFNEIDNPEVRQKVIGEMTDLMTSGAAKDTDEAFEKVAERMSLEYSDNYADNILASNTPEYLQALAQKGARERGIVGVIKGLYDDAGDISDSKLDDLLKNHQENFDALGALMGSGDLTTEQSYRILDTLESAAYDADEIRKIASNQKILSGQVGKFTQSLERSALKYNIPEKWENIYSTAKKVPIAGWGLTLGEWSGKLGKVTVGNEWGRLYSWIAISYLGIMQDSINQKFVPAGKNALVATQPTILGLSGGKVQFDLESLEGDILVLYNYKDYKRLNLVSPCIADLSITPRTLVQELKADSVIDYDLYDFGKGLVPVEKGTMVYKDYVPDKWQIATPAGDILIGEGDNLMEQGDVKGALIKYEEFAQKYPNSTKFDDVAGKIDDILQNEDYIRKIGKDELKKIAFVERVPLQERAQFSANWFQVKYGDTQGCADPANYNDPKWQRTCHDSLLDLDAGGTGGAYEPFILSFVRDAPGSQGQSLYDWQPYDFYSYYGDLVEKYRYITGKYTKSLLYVMSPDNQDYLNEYDDIFALQGAQRADEYAYDAWCVISTCDFVGKTATYHITAARLPWANPNNLDSFMLGSFLVPKHLVNASAKYFDKRVDWLPSFDTYQKEEVSYNSQIRSDQNYADDTYDQLMIKKEFYEKAIPILDYQGESDTVSDYEDQWVAVSRELVKRFKKNIDISNAVKVINYDTMQMDTGFLDDSTYFRMRSIVTEPTLVGGYQSGGNTVNYCYQGYDSSLEFLKKALVVSGFFLDEVAGTAAGAACAASGVGIAASGICARGAMVVTNMGLAFAEKSVNDRYKWPQHRGR